MQTNRLVDWCDVIFFEFGHYPLNVVTTMPCVNKPIIVRAHGIELFRPNIINWDKVNLLIVSPICKQMFLDSQPKTMPKQIKEMMVGIDLGMFPLSPVKIAKKFGKRIVTQSSVMRPKKRIYTTIQLFKELVDEDPSWDLYIVGEWVSQYRESTLEDQEQYNWPIRKLLETLNLEEKVWFTPQMGHDVWSHFLKDKDLYWSNSFLEGFHVSCVEATSTGMYPVVNCWYGAEGIFPDYVVHKTLTGMKRAILEWGSLSETGKLNKAEAMHEEMKRFDVKKIARQIREEIENVAR